MLSMFWGNRERSKHRQSSQESFVHWDLDLALIDLMTEIVEGIVGENDSDNCVVG